MPIDITVGLQWGDEGKGRIVDLLAAKADVVARYNGGDNAGHTVTVSNHIFKLHLIPSGIIHPHTFCVMGSGMVVNPLVFLSETASLREAGVPISPARLAISHAAHLITPAHRLLDGAQETALGGGRIGTTGRGIGPAYTDKAARTGLRAGDLLHPLTFQQKLTAHLESVSQKLTVLYKQPGINIEQMAVDFSEKALQLAPYICDTGALLRQRLHNGQKILVEGAQGTLLDLDHGTYPYVTSSTTTAPGVLTGLGLGMQLKSRVIGVVKAFQSRVGEGPFITELHDELAARLRGTGENPWDEYGTTTGRPRRVGWLDCVLLHYAVAINGVSELVITKLDILSGLPVIRICAGYRYKGADYNELPAGLSAEEMGEYQPLYQEMPGWQQDLTMVRRWEDLPIEAQAYILKIEAICGVPVRMISVGPEREQIIYHW